MLRIIILFLVFCISLGARSQKVEFSGIITTSDNKPLPNTNVLAIAKYEDLPPAYGITNTEGVYSIILQSNITYTLSVSHMGYITFTEDVLVPNQNTQKNITLQTATNELEEIVLEYTPPIKVKKDTTTYDVNAFTNGKERKLGAILKKLPGIDVNRKGEVFFKNQKVTQVQVENKTFFNGNSRFAVENIPAEVIDAVDMIEDYHETPFMKGVQESEELIMNIRLKEDKKKFAFGDIETGVGYEDVFKLHPSIFKYQPKFVYNIIGDANNTYSKSFSLTDYFQLEGETSPDKFLRLMNSPLSKFLQDDTYFKNTHYFAGTNLQYNPNEKHEFRLFTLLLKDKSSNQTRTLNIYQAGQVEEERSLNSVKDHQIFFSKFKYRFTPDAHTVIKFEGRYESTVLNGQNLNSSLSEGLERNYNALNDSENFIANGKLEIEKWFSDSHISTASIEIEEQQQRFDQLWVSEENIFTPTIPVVDTSAYLVGGNEFNKIRNIDFRFEHFYRPSSIDLITFSFYGNIHRNNLNTLNNQTINNSEIPFEGFENQLLNNTNILNNSITYKRYLFGKIIATAGVNYQSVFWKDRQSDLNYARTENHLLPSVALEWEFARNKKVQLSYNVSRMNPIPEFRLRNNKILDFNRIFLGNPFLGQSITERMLLKLSLSRTYGWSFYANLGWRKQEDPVLNIVQFEGINGFNTPFQFNGANTGYDVVLRLRQNQKYWKGSFESSYYQNNTNTVLNEVETEVLTQRISNNLSISTNIENAPNADFTARNTIIFNQNQFFSNKTIVTEIDAACEYDYKRWKFNASWLQTFYANESQNNNTSFNTINASVLYHKEDSLWEFGIDMYNLGKNDFQISNSYNPTVFNETAIRVFPRTIMLLINYKL